MAQNQWQWHVILDVKFQHRECHHFHTSIVEGHTFEASSKALILSYHKIRNNAK